MTASALPAIDQALSRSLTPALVIRRDLTIVWANPAFEKSYPSRAGQVAEFLKYQSDVNVNSMFFLFDKMSNNQPWQGPFTDQSGRKKRYFDVSASPLPGELYLLLISELTEHQEKLEDALHSSLSDRLTGLPNRRHFNDSITQAVKQARRGRSNQALLLLDLDGFKPVNDTYGHDAGDAVLVEAALRMRASLRETDFCARLGGDEFACIVSNLKTKDDAGLIADKLIQSVSQPIAYGKHILHINVSIGIAMIDKLKKTDETIKNADRALYLSKQQGKGCWRFPPDPASAIRTLAAPIFSDDQGK